MRTIKILEILSSILILPSALAKFILRHWHPETLAQHPDLNGGLTIALLIGFILWIITVIVGKKKKTLLFWLACAVVAFFFIDLIISLF